MEIYKSWERLPNAIQILTTPFFIALFIITLPFILLSWIIIEIFSILFYS